MARVTVAVNVRDMTRGDLRRIRGQMDGLTRSINRFTGNMSQRNLRLMNRDFERMGAQLGYLRGRIPLDEFNRLNFQLGRMRGALNTTIGPVRAHQLAVMRAGLRDINREVSRISNQRGQAPIRITAQDDTRGGINQAHRSIRRWIAGPLPGLARFAGGTLSDGIGQGFANTFKSNPYVAAALTAVLLAAMSAVGAALAGALVLAVGGAFVGLGMFIAARSKEVTRNWESELNRLKPMFEQAAEPMIPVLHRATHIMGDMGAQFAPKLEQALTRAAPMINGFIDSTKRGFEKLGENAWDDLQQSFRVFLDAFGPYWEDFLAEFGNSLGALSRTVSNHSEEIAIALRGVLGIINLLIDTINFFANAWVMGLHLMIDSSAMLLKGIGYILDAFLGMIDGMLSGLESVASVFGFEDEVARARAAFNDMREDAVGKFNDMSAKVKQLGIDIDHHSRKRKLEVDIAAWTAELNRAKEELKSVPPEKRTELLARIADLEAKIRSATGQLNSMQKDYYVRIHAYRVGDWAIGGGGPQAHGGVTGNWGRAATGGARSNMTLVGEQGPELVNLAPGSHVKSNPDSRRMLAAGQGGGGQRIELVLKSSGRRIDDLLLEVLRDSIHQRGGDPVTVLGGR